MSTSVVLILLVVLFMAGVAVSVFSKPMHNMVNQMIENQRIGLWNDPEFRRQMRRLDAVRWLTILVQILLLGVAVVLVSRPSMIGWIALVVLFVASFFGSKSD